MFDTTRRAALAAAAVLLLPHAVLAQSQPPRNKVVFQVSDADPQKWNLVLNNARNLQDDIGSDLIELARRNSLTPTCCRRSVMCLQVWSS